MVQLCGLKDGTSPTSPSLSPAPGSVSFLSPEIVSPEAGHGDGPYASLPSLRLLPTLSAELLMSHSLSAFVRDIPLGARRCIRDAGPCGRLSSGYRRSITNAGVSSRYIRLCVFRDSCVRTAAYLSACTCFGYAVIACLRWQQHHLPVKTSLTVPHALR